MLVPHFMMPMMRQFGRVAFFVLFRLVEKSGDAEVAGSCCWSTDSFFAFMVPKFSILRSCAFEESSENILKELPLSRQFFKNMIKVSTLKKTEMAISEGTVLIKVAMIPGKSLAKIFILKLCIAFWCSRIFHILPHKGLVILQMNK